eukprot:snap_masked-scaffold_34-processed-gene-2.9-mRNA-1 protein AED:0.02 eAED:0.02 QI:0/-1/0/1/-1/1/1/0/190
MAISIRRAKASDLIAMQDTNLHCLPENYQIKYYLYHFANWPHLLHVAERQGYSGKDKQIVGYVLAKLDEESSTSKKNKKATIHGHITSLSVISSYRKLGLATKLMRQAQREMVEVYNAEYVSLHVRRSNKAAFHLYNVVLGYEIHETDKGYYADGEDAFAMRHYFHKKVEVDKLAEDLEKTEIKHDLDNK